MFPRVLALVAAVNLLLQPVICAFLHTVEHWMESHELADSHCLHAAHAVGVPCEDAPALTDVHHCCNGHDRPVAVLPAKTKHADSQADRMPFDWNMSLSFLAAEANSSHTPIPPLIPSDQEAQGKLCALLCRWLI